MVGGGEYDCPYGTGEPYAGCTFWAVYATAGAAGGVRRLLASFMIQKQKRANRTRPTTAMPTMIPIDAAFVSPKIDHTTAEVSMPDPDPEPEPEPDPEPEPEPIVAEAAPMMMSTPGWKT